MKTSRQRLLEYIQKHRYVTVAELSRALRMSRANARHHLAILEEQGLVVETGERTQGQGRGRPSLIYTLADTVQAHSLGELSGILLDLLAEQVPTGERTQLYRQVAFALKSVGQAGSNGRSARLAQDAEVETSRMTNLTGRLTTTVQGLNQLNYHARWEAHAQGPQLILTHCPYAAILKRHPEMCQIDRYLLQELSGAPVVQTERLTPDERGVPFCRFVLQSR